jgi:hypothetical protein
MMERIFRKTDCGAEATERPGLHCRELPEKSIFGDSKGDAAISCIILPVKGRAFVNR